MTGPECLLSDVQGVLEQIFRLQVHFLIPVDEREDVQEDGDLRVVVAGSLLELVYGLLAQGDGHFVHALAHVVGYEFAHPVVLHG